MVRTEWIVKTVPEVGLNRVAAMASVWSVCPELRLTCEHRIMTIFCRL